jgi:hypothetical protein
MTAHHSLAAAACAAALLISAGCERIEEAGMARNESVSINLDKTEMVHVEIKMGAGELRVRGGSPKLMEGDFRFHGDRRPEVRYEPSPFRGRLYVFTPDSRRRRFVGPHGEEWSLRLNEGVPMDIDVNLGAGQSELNLGSLNIRDLAVNIGAGELRLDLRGTPKRNMSVRVNGGVGEAIVHLPDTVGIRLEAHGGIGSINAFGLTRRGSYYQNDLYEKSSQTMDVRISGGIGSIRVYAD